MHPTIQQLQSEMARSLRGLDATHTQLRPPASRPSKWSIQQIVEHLLLTYVRTEAALQTRIVKAAPTQGKPSLLQSFSQYTILRLGYFPAGREAPAVVMPPASAEPLPGDALTQAASDHLASLDQRCADASAIFGESNRCATHMILGPLSIQQWRRFQVVHTQHHLKQIAAIRRAHNL